MGETGVDGSGLEGIEALTPPEALDMCRTCWYTKARTGTPYIYCSWHSRIFVGVHVACGYDCGAAHAISGT